MRMRAARGGHVVDRCEARRRIVRRQAATYGLSWIVLTSCASMARDARRVRGKALFVQRVP